jgi:hypothetical protein
MYKTSTTFKKAQTPGIDIPVLLDLYKQELEYQSVTDIKVNDNNIKFKDRFFKLVERGAPQKFLNFSSGQILIEETDLEYIVTLTADMSKLFIRAGIGAGIVIIFLAVCGLVNTGTLFFGLFVFVILFCLPYLLTVTFFPVYFTNLRNRIEKVLQNEHPR